jgi:hypothetical protein
MAGEPDVVECVPVAAGRSVDGVAGDCAEAGIATAVATRQAAICFFRIVISPGGVRSNAALGGSFRVRLGGASVCGRSCQVA